SWSSRTRSPTGGSSSWRNGSIRLNRFGKACRNSMKERNSRWTSSERTSGASTTFSVRLAPRSIRDFDEAMDWLKARASPEVAGRWAAALDQKIGTLAELLDRCPVACESDAFKEDVRQLLFGGGRGHPRNNPHARYGSIVRPLPLRVRNTRKTSQRSLV